MREYLIVAASDAEIAGPFGTMEESEAWLRQRLRRGDAVHAVLSVYYNVGVRKPSISPLSAEYLSWLHG